MDSIKKASIIKLCLVVYSFVLAYIYVDQFGTCVFDKSFKNSVIVVLIAAGFVLWSELTKWYQRLENKFEVKKANVIEARFWEVILLALAATVHFGADSDLNYFLMHIVVVYMVLCGTGHLFMGETSVLVFADLWSGFFRIPFANFVVRSRTVISSIKALVTNKEELDDKAKQKRILTVIISIAFVIVAIIVFWVVFGLLSEVDASFGQAYEGIADYLEHLFDDFEFYDVVLTFVISVFIGCYLSGLYFGTANCPANFENKLEAVINRNYKKLKIIPAVIFYIVSAMFIIMYTLFFISQARLLFSGFAGILPEEFTASEYARDGFSQLSVVLVINFMGLGVMRLFSSKSVVDSKITASGSIALMVTSMIFSVISASKIILYISRFGYTPLRAESMWFTVVAFAGSALAIYNIATAKKTFKPWMIFAAVSFIAMNIVAGTCAIA
ncbi:MAG: DUF4173 domain-containing protein [Clostridia bacterium]|nr:DUF4173 domain-containing protein [Clostridia bacterium]